MHQRSIMFTITSMHEAGHFSSARSHVLSLLHHFTNCSQFVNTKNGSGPPNE